MTIVTNGARFRLDGILFPSMAQDGNLDQPGVAAISVERDAGFNGQTGIFGADIHQGRQRAISDFSQWMNGQIPGIGSSKAG
ncbi:MAG: hypothetical protein KUG74_04605 [Rhodobacteraceae bacterium]|nr:hypothetical protein [Paracoccaceae bacterium]